MKKYIHTLLAAFLITSAATAQIDRSKQPVPGPAPVVNLGVPQSFELGNGLKTIVVVNKKLPRVRVQLLIDNPMYANGNKAGVESLLASMLGNGTTTISKEDFNEEIDFLGANVFFGSQSAYASALSKYFPRILELMADGIASPLFTEEEFQKEKDKYLESLKMEKRSVSAIARKLNSALLYGVNHPKGEFVTEETVEGITLQDVKNYYDSFFSPENAYLVVIGDVNYPEVELLVNEHFGKWMKRTVSKIDYADPQDVYFTQINFVDMPNAVQSEIAIQNIVNLKMSDPDYPAVLIANAILGGDFNSLLNMNLREANGWTYGARSSTGAGKEVTRFIATTSVRNSVTDSAVVEALKEIRFIRENKVTTERLANAKAKYVGDFVRAIEHPETIANYALNMETQNLPGDFYETYLKKINDVTADDVQRVAIKYFLADNARIVVVGKGSEVLEGLKNIKREDGKNIPVFYFDTDGNPVDEPVYGAVAVDASVTPESVLNSYFNAIGGIDAVSKVQTVSSVAEGEVPGAPAPVVLTKKTDASGKLLVDMGMMGMSLMKQVVNGDTGYMVAQGQRQQLEGETLEEMKAVAHPFPELALLKKEGLSIKGIEKINDTDAYALVNGINTLYFDINTGLKVADVTSTPEGDNTIFHGNYKEVNGVKLSHDTTVFMGPQSIEFKNATITVNEGVSDEDFE